MFKKVLKSINYSLIVQVQRIANPLYNIILHNGLTIRFTLYDYRVKTM
jgi:hypothetical protein